MVRIGGLASGMDIDSLVKDLMKAERMPLDKIMQKKQKLEWQRDDFRAMNTLLLDFRSELTQMKLTTKYRVRNVVSTNDDRVTANASSAASLSSYSISNVKQLASAATRINAGGVSTDPDAKLDPNIGLYSQTSKLDTSTGYKWSQGIVGSKSIKVTADNTVDYSLELGSTLKASEIPNMSVKVNGTSFEIVTSEADLLKDNQVLVSANGSLKFKKAPIKESVISVNYVLENKVTAQTLTSPAKEWQLAEGALASDISLKVNDVTYTVSEPAAVDSEGFVTLTDGTNSIGKINLETGKIKFDTEQAADTKLEATYKHNYATFNLTSHTSKGAVKENFLVKGTDSLNMVMSKVNESNAGISMFYDSFSDRISLTRKETGNFRGEDPTLAADEAYTYSAATDGEIETGGDFFNKLLKFDGATETGGENAVFEINGLSTERSSNTFDINGVTFTLKQTFSDAPVNLSISNDSQKVFDNIKEFVTKYNELIGKIQTKIGEDVYRSYQPLTDEQRESLSDKQQEQWEEKAKSGLLKRDPILSQLLSGMRSDFYTPVQNDSVNPLYNQLASIGIKTTANYLEGGKLEINEAELRKVIEADPSSVEKLFNASGTANAERGIVQRLYDTVNASFEKLKKKAGGSGSVNTQFELGKQLIDMDKRIDSFEDKLKRVEDRYWRQFTAMEKAIQRSNEQSMFLMNQFNSGM
ncbi:flagellar filament capping protein FliD [Bacillus sp. ISL-47]|uniref:flagellar filament capping protein FliD n=1 Tax=Bacillus sp. ISL-47 TaxID=2819130 RepID=UPI001BE8A902|nr:flagellar filament capping protein FliD [Bacillus sp. ISL-47]MBT2687159.1 flagellar filament capping protein FliD [Bacillus sp. ISL-47]MBT2709758.1 flagellar filament capping protein FliD [Pseudomonas sp. ISL-84]